MTSIVWADEVPLESLVPGTQVLYVPTHASADVTHKDVEAGFITSLRVGVDKPFAFVRYFWGPKRAEHEYDLRTKNNGEATDLWHLVLRQHRDQTRINEMTRKVLMEANLYWEPGMVEPMPMTEELDMGYNPQGEKSDV